MRARFAFLLAALCITCFAQSQPIEMRLYIGGSLSGSNRYERQGDAFTSATTLEVGPVKIASSVTGHLHDGKLLDFQSDSKTPQGETALSYVNGKLKVTTGGKSNELPFVDTTGLFAGNLHPQFFSSSLVAADKAIKANPVGKQTTISAFMIDAGAVVPLKITALPSRKVMVDGVERTGRMFTVSLGPLDLTIAMDDANRIIAEDVAVQKLRFVVPGWEGLFVDPITKFPELSQATHKTTIDRSVRAKMRDGVELECDVMRPVDEGKYPVILVRTPYGRSTELPNGEFYASRGYVYVVQDCRGRSDSAGDWDPFTHEGPDGFDTIAWLAKQPWSNGKVGMIGASYAGYVQWAAAVLNPPALKCIIPQVSPPDAMRNIPYDHGVFALYPDLWWARIVAGRTADFAGLKGGLPNPKGLLTLPLSKVDDAALGQDLPFFNKWLQRPTINDWKGVDFTYYLQNAKVPALHISGIWDGDEIGTHINWTTMRSLGRKDQWIIFGPWVHAFNTNKTFGDVSYGDDAIIELDSTFLRWFDTWLKGKEVSLKKVPRVRLFVTGANRWIELPDWPAPTTPQRTLYFSSNGLKPVAGKSERKGYTYDPAKDEIPKEMLSEEEEKASTKISEQTLRKGGSLLLKSDILKKDTAIAAPYTVRLNFTTSAKDTDFFAAIVDVLPNGEMRLLGQLGKFRASYLGGFDKVRPLTPGKTYTVTLTPWDFAHEFKKGHRIGLIISSSGFPAFARNLGTTEPIATATRMVVQKNTILMGKANPSSFKFHVLWEK